MKIDSTGKVAIFDETGVGNAPFTDPLGNLSRIRFHSDLLTPAVVSVTTYTVTLPSMVENAWRDATVTLGAHGRTGTPMIMGRVRNGSGASWIPLNGSVMLPMYALDGSTTYRLFGAYPSGPPYWQGGDGWRSITLGADATNIVLHEQAQALSKHAGADITHPALTLEIEVTVFDINLDAANPTVGTDPVAVHMSASLVKFQRGKWRSDRRYIRTPAPTPTHYMPLGKTVEVGGGPANKGDLLRSCCHAGPVKFKSAPGQVNDITFDASQQPVGV